MKRSLLIAVALIGLTAMSVQAQTAPNVLRSSPTHVPTDTAINATPKFQLASIPGFADVVTFQFVVTKISGTVAGTVTLQGSLDGVNYANIGSPITVTDVAVQSGAIALTAHNYIHYRINYTGSGTMSAKLNSYWIARKRV